MAKSSKKTGRAGSRSRPDGKASTEAAGPWNLRLYVAGQTAKSMAAFANLRRLCEQHLAGRYSIEVIDLVENPHLAAGDQILAVPTLVRKLPSPLKRVIGTLSDEDRFLVGMDLKAQSQDGSEYSAGQRSVGRSNAM